MELVTGATGHIGNVLVRELVAQGRAVRALVLPKENTRSLAGLPIEIVEGNVLDLDSLRCAMQDVTCVYHLAGMITIMPGKNEQVRRVNVEGTRNIIQLMRELQIRRLVYTSSIHALKRVPQGILMDENLPFDPDNPVGAYDRSKAEASLLIQQAVRDGLDAVLVCPTGVIGPHDYLGSEMGVLIHSWMDSGVRFLIKGAYDFVDVRDVAHGIVLAGERGKAGQVYILSGEKIHMERMQVLVRQAAGLQPQVILIPTWLALFAANFTPWYYRMTGSKPRFTRYSVVTVTGNSDISSQRARSELGYQPRSLHESLQDTVQWWHAYLQNKTGEPAAIL